MTDVLLQHCAVNGCACDFLMANDYVTSPVTHRGQILYAIFIGIMTGIIRTWSPTAEGASYSILLGNLLVPILDRVSIPTPFGKGGKKK